jgi:hypothetical protein
MGKIITPYEVDKNTLHFILFELDKYKNHLLKNKFKKKSFSDGKFNAALDFETFIVNLIELKK